MKNKGKGGDQEDSQFSDSSDWVNNVTVYRNRENGGVPSWCSG